MIKINRPLKLYKEILSYKMKPELSNTTMLMFEFLFISADSRRYHKKCNKLKRLLTILSLRNWRKTMKINNNLRYCMRRISTDWHYYQGIRLLFRSIWMIRYQVLAESLCKSLCLWGMETENSLASVRRKYLLHKAIWVK
jgi:hypothetical protein